MSESVVPFEVTGEPQPEPMMTVQSVPAAPPLAPVDYWVFQAYDNSGGFTTYTLPINPRSYTPAYGNATINSESTTVSNGNVISWEGQGDPPLMQWSGEIFTKEHYEMLELLGLTGQRIYITDHFRYRVLAKIEAVRITRVRHRSYPWRHAYEASAWMLSEEVLV